MNPQNQAIASLMIGWIVLASTPSPGKCGELRVDEIGVDRGLVTARVVLVDAFDSDTRASIVSGLPITVRFTTEIWRERRRWFDKQLDARVTTYRVRWDPGERVFTLTHPGRPRRDVYEALDPLLDELAHQLLPVYARWDLEDRHQYFLILEAAIRPVTLEEFRELDGWIGGRIRGGADDPEAPDEPPGGSGGIAGTVFRFLKDLSGFGDTIFRARTGSFRPSELAEITPSGA